MSTVDALFKQLQSLFLVERPPQKKPTNSAQSELFKAVIAPQKERKQFQSEKSISRRYLSFQHVDFSLETGKVSEVLQTAKGHINDIPEDLWNKIKQAAARVTSLKLHGILVSQNFLKTVAANFCNLQVFEIQHGVFQKDSIELLALFDRLKSLSVAFSSRALDLPIEKLKHLTALNVSGTTIDDAWLQKVKACHKLERLFMAYCEGITKTGLNTFLEGSFSLRVLNIAYCPGIHPKFALQLKRVFKNTLRINSVSYTASPCKLPQIKCKISKTSPHTISQAPTHLPPI